MPGYILTKKHSLQYIENMIQYSEQLSQLHLNMERKYISLYLGFRGEKLLILMVQN